MDDLRGGSVANVPTKRQEGIDVPNLSDQFVARTGSGKDIESRARAGLAPAVLHVNEIAKLMGARPDHDRTDLTAGELRSACSRGILKAKTSSTDFQGNTLTDRVMFLVHRDHARQYFMSLDMEPAEGSPLWCWLKGKPSTEAGKPRADQQDKTDFKQLCCDYWVINPGVSIRGESGVVAQVGKAYLRNYKPATLYKWAGEAKPATAPGPGRPKKKQAEGDK